MNNHPRPYRENPLLRFSYSLIAPLYDLAISLPLQKARTRSLQSLPTELAGKVLLSGGGTGLDLPMLPKLHHYTALDFNTSMLTRRFATRLDVVFENESAKVPQLRVLSDVPLLAGGWFRKIVLQKF